MVKNSTILSALLNSSGKNKKRIYSEIKQLSKEELNQELKSLNMFDYNARDVFVFRLYDVIEHIVFENTQIIEMADFQDLIVERWNLANTPKISHAVADTALQKTRLKDANLRKAFLSLCDGSLEDYKRFTDKPKMFVELLLKLLITITPNNQLHTVRSEVEEIVFLAFEGIEQKYISNILNETGFLSRIHNRYIFMSTYQKEFKAEDLVFTKGMTNIIEELFEGRELSDSMKNLNVKLNNLHRNEELSQEVIAFIDSENVPKPNQPETRDEEINPIEIEVKLPSHVENTQNDISSAVIEDSTENQEILLSLQSALQSVQLAMGKVEPLLAVTKLNNTQLAQTSSGQKLAIAEEEIKRLNVALESERERAKQIEGVAYETLLKAIGGESSNYLLSDLYTESQGQRPEHTHMSTGRLVNLFSSLSMAIGLEEHSNGRELNDIFEVGKKELIKNFHIDGPVISQADKIRVKLLKYGWTLNGVVIIRPLVTEIKEEQ